MSIYFISDTHFGHRNVLRHDDRPFSSIKEHDQALVENWNSIVKPSDLVYHLGDVFMGCSPGYAKEILDSLNGQLYLIEGNHDHRYIKKQEIRERFIWTKGIHTLDIKKDKKVVHQIVLCHYALRTWHKKHWGSYHLYGHSHGNLEEGDYLSFDVGVNLHNYHPISLEYVVDRLEGKKEQIQKGENKNVVE
jgi:calcineurin-like phosphoesterase family protein